MDKRCCCNRREVNQAHASSNGSSNNQTNQNRDRLDKSFGKDVDQEDNQNSDSCKQETLTSWLWNVIPIFPIATGIKVKPIVVMTEPVTIDGKRLATFEKVPETRTT